MLIKIGEKNGWSGLVICETVVVGHGRLDGLEGFGDIEALSFLGFRANVLCRSHLGEHIFGSIGPSGEFGKNPEDPFDPFILRAIVVGESGLQRAGFVVGRDEIDIVDDKRVLKVWVLGDCGDFDRRLAEDCRGGRLRAIRRKCFFV